MSDRARPLAYTESHKSEGYGERYESIFQGDSYDNRVWYLETEILASLFEGKSFGKFVDFGCGTGRITSYLHPYAKETIGVDVSDAMLAHSPRLRNKRLLMNHPISFVSQSWQVGQLSTERHPKPIVIPN